MRFLVLGPLEVHADNGPVALGSPKERRVLALLLSRRGHVVSSDALVDAVWDGSPPRSGAKTLQTYIVHLRRALANGGSRGASPIVTRDDGYVLEVPPDAVDASRFRDLAGRGALAHRDGEWGMASVLLEEALQLWRGPPYGEFADEPFVRDDALGLGELRLTAWEARIDADLALGSGSALVGELEQLVASHPTREHFCSQLMTALYQAGRQAEALAAYRRARDVLVAELGTEPGPELRATEQAVLAHDARLAVPGTTDGWTLPASLSTAGPPMEGRGAELAWLRGRWADAVAGRGGVVVVSGPPGVGKSRLLAELGREAHARGAVVHHREGGRPPNPGGLVRAAAGRPVLVLLDEPITAIAQELLGRLPVLVVVAVDGERAAPHVLSGFLEAERRELGPLGDSEARRVVVRYLGPDATGVDVDGVLRGAGGVPGRLHDLAAAAAEDSATARIGAALEASRAVRGDLALARDGLRDGIEDLRRSRAVRAARRRPPPALAAVDRPPTCPYKGLLHYDEGDAALFHGRDALIALLVARVAESPLVAVIGGSGTGKSSLVRAGLLAALADGCLPGSSRWPRYLLTAGAVPPVIDADRAVVVVDQFEEVWSLLDAAARAVFVDAVVAFADAGHRVVITLRADYLERCAEHDRLRALVSEGGVLVGRMTDREVREAVVGPAERLGLTVDPAVVDRVVEEVRTEAAALPLMSAALVNAWEQRSGSHLTAAGYDRAGGVSAAVARAAEAAYSSLTGGDDVAARRLLLRLAGVGEGDAVVRRRVPLAEVADDPATRRALDVLVANRLVTAMEEHVEVAHEALFTHWPRLARWLAEDAEGRAFRAHLAPAAVEWDRQGRPESELYRGLRLDAAAQWAGQHPEDLLPLERDFIAQSQARAGRELEVQRDRADHEAAGRRRLRTLALALTATLVLTVAVAFVALDQRREAEDSARRATARQLSSAALVASTLDRSLLLAVAAVRLEDSVEARGALLTALGRSPAVLRVLRGGGGGLLSAATSADARHLVAGDGAGNVVTWDLRTEQQVGAPVRAAPRAIVEISARPGSGELVLASTASDGSPLITRWDAAARQPIGAPLPGATSPITSTAWSSDGRWLAGVQDEGDVLVWDLDALTGPPLRLAAGASDYRTVASAGGRAFVVVEEAGEAAVWIPGAEAPERTFDVGGRHGVSAVGSSVDGRHLTVGHFNGSAVLWDLRTGHRRAELTGHAGTVQAVAFDPAATTVATLGDDQDVILSSVSSGKQTERLDGHAGRVTAGVFAGDGRTLYTASLDSSVIVWDVSGERRLGHRFRGSAGAGSTWTAISPSGAVAVAQPGGHVRFWDGERGVPQGPAVAGEQEEILASAFSPDGSALATVAVGGSVVLWDVNSRTGSPLVTGLPGDANEVAFSPDGRLLAVCVWSPGTGTIHIVDVATRRQLGAAISVGWGMPQLAWSPDGTRVGVASWEVPRVEVHSVVTRERVWSASVAQEGTASSSIAWSPDGATIATGDNDGRVRFWDAATGRASGDPIDSHEGPIITSAFSPDGRLLATAATDGTAVLVDVASRRRLGRPLPATPGEYTMARFDGRGRLFVASQDGSVWRWDVSFDSWVTRACTMAGRNLTTDEWAELGTGRVPAPSCS